jgi:hypothetical protein
VEHSCPTPIPQALDYEFLGTLDILAGPTLMLGEFQAGWRRYDLLIGGTFRGPRISGRIEAGRSDLLHRHHDLTLPRMCGWLSAPTTMPWCW